VVISAPGDSTYRREFNFAREHLAEVERKTADLATLQRELDSIISQCSHGTVAECRIIE
jgi:hypothetical protein